MKIIASALLLLASTAGFAAGWKLADASPDRLEVKELVVRSACGKHAVTIKAFEGGVGLWVGTETRNVATVSGGLTGTFLGVYGGNDLECPLAIAASDDGVRVGRPDQLLGK